MGVVASKIVKTRRKRICWGCGTEFERGARLRSQVNTNSGDKGGSYWCKVCDKTMESEHKNSEDESLFASVCKYESWQDNLSKYSRTYTIEDLQEFSKSQQVASSTEETAKLATSSSDYKQEIVSTEKNIKSVKRPTNLEQVVAEFVAFSSDYKKKVAELTERYTDCEQEVATTEAVAELVARSTSCEQEVATTEAVAELVARSTNREQEVATTEAVAELVARSTNREQEVAISLHSYGDHVKEFLEYFKAFDASTLLNDLKGIGPGYEENDKFHEIADDLEDFEELAKQLFVNIENYVFEPVLREDEDNRSLYLIYLTNEKENSLENRLIGVADNVERLQYTVHELLNQYTIGKNSETYNFRRFNDVSYLNTIPYLFIEEKILNHFETNGIYLSEAE